MTPPDRDPWLDAFEPSELDEPDLHALDRSVDRVVARLGREEALPALDAAPANRTWLLPFVVGAITLAAGLLLGVALVWGLTPASPADAPFDAQPQVAETPPSPPVTPPVVPPVQGAPEPTSPDRVAEGVEPPPPTRLPGLIDHPGSKVSVRKRAAVLSRGVLSYRHDAQHDPKVNRVTWAELPLIAQPVGTRFEAASAAGMGALSVTEGRVRLQHNDGTLMATLHPGDERTLLLDPGASGGVRIVNTSGMGIDAVKALAGDGQSAEELVSMVARMRLIALQNRPQPGGP